MTSMSCERTAASAPATSGPGARSLPIPSTTTRIARRARSPSLLFRRWFDDDRLAVVLAAAHADAVGNAGCTAVLAGLDHRVIRTRPPHPGRSLLTDAGWSATTFLQCHTCSGRLVCQFTAAISSL